MLGNTRNCCWNVLVAAMVLLLISPNMQIKLLLLQIVLLVVLLLVLPYFLGFHFSTKSSYDLRCFRYCRECTAMACMT